MNYSKSLLLHEDIPSYGLLLKLIITIVPASLLVSGFYLWLTGEQTGGLVLLAETLFIGFIFWAVFPRRYQVYEDHMRIVLGGPFSVKVGFNKIKTIRPTNKLSFTVNFATRLTKSYTEIVMNRGLSIAITPRDNNVFVEYANQALSRWAKENTERRL